MVSIFDRIFRYRQREHKTPSEDYFTETLVAVLMRCESLRIAFVAWLTPMDRENIKAVRMETQKVFEVGRDGGRRRPDIWVEIRDAEDRRHVVIIENKVDSGEGKNQLLDYAEVLERQQDAMSRTLVYITKFSTDPKFQERETMTFKHLKWFDVYRILYKEQQDAEGVGELLRELLKLMEGWNMDGRLFAAHLRATVISMGANVGKRLQSIQDEAWTESEIGEVLQNTWMPGKKWSYQPEDRGFQTSPPILNYAIQLRMAFRFDRREKEWDVDKLELPSPAVTVRRYAKGNRDLPKPSERWSGPVEGMDPVNIWVRQPVPGKVPHHGDPLDEYYKEFFLDAFTELRRAFESHR